jgi:hypothetical protein
MSPPYRKSEFEIVYGKGIDVLEEMMSLLNEFELGRKYGKTMTVDGTKYDLEEFKKLVVYTCKKYLCTVRFALFHCFSPEPKSCNILN